MLTSFNNKIIQIFLPEGEYNFISSIIMKATQTSCMHFFPLLKHSNAFRRTSRKLPTRSLISSVVFNTKMLMQNNHSCHSPYGPYIFLRIDSDNKLQAVLVYATKTDKLVSVRKSHRNIRDMLIAA